MGGPPSLSCSRRLSFICILDACIVMALFEYVLRSVFFCLQETGCDHFKSAGDPHPLCDICSKVSTGRFCTTTDTCDLCKDLDKAVWRRITDTRRRRDNRMRQQNLTYGVITTTPVTDPSDSGFHGDPFLEARDIDEPPRYGSYRGPILVTGSPAGRRAIFGRVLA